jgi:hypothetical protein
MGWREFGRERDGRSHTKSQNPSDPSCALTSYPLLPTPYSLLPTPHPLPPSQRQPRETALKMGTGGNELIYDFS